MENKRPVKYGIWVIIGAALLAPIFVSAYEPNTTHKGLTRDIIRFYEYHYGETFNEEEQGWIENGSVREDDNIRPLFHFYDPVYNRGFKGNITSKDWSQSTKVQASLSPKYLAGAGSMALQLFRSNTDFSWDRAVYEYVYESKERGLESLGHTLHLIEDATVPDHTRNDAHPSFFDEQINQASPYEHWTSENFNADNIAVTKELLKQGERPVTLGSLDEYFDSLAKYSNENFFSKSTILDSDYLYPEIDFEKRVDNNLFGYSKNDGAYKLVRVHKKPNLFTRKLDNKYFLKDPDNLILADYWNLLSKKAVANGAGVVKLFFDDVERERKTLALYNKNKSVFARIFDKTQASIFGMAKSLYGSSIDEDTFQELNPDAEIVGVPTVVAVADPAHSDMIKSDSAPEENNIILSEEILNKEEPDTSNIYEVQSEPDETKTPVPDDSVKEEEENDTSPDRGMFHAPILGGGASAPQVETGDNTPPEPPVITSPSNFASVFTSASITFSGTAEATSIISTDFSSATTSANGEGAWSFELTSLPQATTTIDFFATDESGNTSAATSTTLFIDSIAPPVSLVVANCTDSLSASACLVATTTLSISWSSSASDLAHFVIKSNGVASTSSATSTTVSASDDSTFSFAVSAVDKFGNTSATTTQDVRVSTSPVVINEVAWAGTSASSADEWIELHNKTSSDVSLDGWTLYTEDGTPYIPLSGVIAANGYYLIERTDDNTVASTTADLIVPFSGLVPGSGISNGGEHIILSRRNSTATTTIDEVLSCNNFCGKGDSNSYRTAERYDPYAVGNDWSNWGSAIGEFIQNGVDSNGTAIKGTPRAKNSISYQIANGATLTENKTLTKANSPYLIGRNGFTVSSGATLTLESGAVVKFVSANEPSLVVDGSLKADGTNSDPVVFTSFYDDEYGGDMNGDGICDPDNASSTASCPSPGLWMQIMFDGSDTGSYMRNTVVRYGGRWFASTPYKGMVVVKETDISIDDSTFSYSDKHGLYLVNSTSTVSDSIFANNAEDNSTCGLYGAGGEASITNNTFADNKTGLCFNDSSATIQNNTFTSNTYRAAQYFGRMAGGITGNSGSNNGINGIVIYGYIAQGNSTTTLFTNNIPYVINIDDVKTTASSTLAIDEGTTVKFEDKELQIYGRLVILGTQGSPVLFTSAYDDSDGNDALNDGVSEGRVSGNQGVYMKSDSSSDIDYAEFRYMKTATSYANPSPIDISDIIYSYNDLGVYAAQGETIIRAYNITFNDNTATSTISLIAP